MRLSPQLRHLARVLSEQLAGPRRLWPEGATANVDDLWKEYLTRGLIDPFDDGAVQAGIFDDAQGTFLALSGLRPAAGDVRAIMDHWVRRAHDAPPPQTLRWRGLTYLVLKDLVDLELFSWQPLAGQYIYAMGPPPPRAVGSSDPFAPGPQLLAMKAERSVVIATTAEGAGEEMCHALAKAMSTLVRVLVEHGL